MSSQMYCVRTNHPLSRFYCFPRKLPFPGRNGIVELPSFHHAYYYAMFIQQGKPDKAEALLNDESIEWDASLVLPWCKANGLEPISADLVIATRQIYEDLMFYQMDIENTTGNDDFLKALKYQMGNSMSDPKTDGIMVCSGADDMIFSCGFTHAEVKKLVRECEEKPILASHIWSKVLRSVVDVRLGIRGPNYNILPKMEFMRRRVGFQESHKKTVFLGSNSIFRYLKGIQLGDFQVTKSATFEDIINRIHALETDPCDYHYLILQGGVIESDRGKNAEIRTMNKLKTFLENLVDQPNCPDILVCPTFPYMDCHSRSRGYDRWLARPENLGTTKILESGKVQIANWDAKNPYFPNGQRAEDLFDGDSTHISREGTMHYWKVLTGYLPDLGLVPYDLHKFPYGDPSYCRTVLPPRGNPDLRGGASGNPRKRPRQDTPEPPEPGRFRLKE